MVANNGADDRTGNGCWQRVLETSAGNSCAQKGRAMKGTRSIITSVVVGNADRLDNPGFLGSNKTLPESGINLWLRILQRQFATPMQREGYVKT
jgi:hypothetical protein